MRISRIILFILIIICCAAVYSCGGDNFVPFQEIPDADLGSDYFEHVILNLGEYQNMYAYLFTEYIEEHGILDFDHNPDDYYELREEAYINWKEAHPEKFAVVESNIPKLYAMTKRITRANYIYHMETMKHLIDSYVSALYINSPVSAPEEEPTEPQTDKNGEPVPPEHTYFPPIDVIDARENIAGFVSAEFFSKNPQRAAADYLSENNIHVTRIAFDPVFTSFNHHFYPFRIEYKYKIFYYKGDTPVEDEKKWESATVRMIYFLILNEKREYVIDYVNNPAAVQEIKSD